MTTNEIIEKILNEVNLNQSAFLRKIGISSSTFSEIKSGRLKNISRRIATKIVATYPQFSITWLMTGEGDMYASGNSAPVFQNSGDNVTNHQGQPQDGGVVVQQLIDMLVRKDEQIKQKDEQMSRLIGVIERLSGGDGGQG